MTSLNAQHKALVALLEEGDYTTVSLVKKELIQSGADQLPVLQQILPQAGASARAALLEIIQEIQASENLGTISRALAQLETFEDLENVCWQLTRAEQPGFDGGPYRRQLDHWASELRPLLPHGASSEETVQAFSRFLAGQQNLTGNSHDYYHPRNCHLSWVMEFRSGLPITLTLIYVLIGRRLGIPIEGISAPGHFLARLNTTIFDPYYNGKILTEGEWDKVCAEVTPQQRAHLMQESSPLVIMHRLLINLRNSHVKRNNLEERRKIDQYLAVLQR